MNNQNIKFSIMTPVYNVAEYLPECLDSVINQSYKNYELILVDDGSTDESGRICDEYAARDSRIKVFHKPNGGLFHTRRFALERITGDYCVFLDSDDYIALNTLEALAGYIEQTHADCVIYGAQWLRPDGTVHVRNEDAFMGRLVTDKKELYKYIFTHNFYNAIWRKCVKATVFDGRDYSDCYRISNGEDIVQSIEIFENSRSILFVEDELYFYRVNAGSITHTNKYDRYCADFHVDSIILAFLRRVDTFTPEDYDRLRNFLLDSQVITIKHICRADTPFSEKIGGVESIRESDYYCDFLEAGYHRVSPLPGREASDKGRSVINRVTVSLINRRSYAAAVALNSALYKLARLLGKR